LSPNLNPSDESSRTRRIRLPIVRLAPRRVRADPFDFKLFLDEVVCMASEMMPNHSNPDTALVFVYDPVQLTITSIEFIPVAIVAKRGNGIFYRWKLYKLGNVYIQIGSRICIESFKDYLSLASSCGEPYVSAVLGAEAELREANAEELDGCEAMVSSVIASDHVAPLEEVYIDVVEQCKRIRIVIGSNSPPDDYCSVWIPRQTYLYLYALNRLMKATLLTKPLSREFVLELRDVLMQHEQISCVAPTSVWIEALRRYGRVAEISTSDDECTSE